jgi:3-methyl-2-oxobutanoate hydroxymethyltransferase
MTLHQIQLFKRQSQKIACLTAYDASFARLIEQAGVEIILVGDSLGMVVQGQESTLAVTLSDMRYHCSMVTRGSKKCFIIADLPFMSYSNPEQACHSAALLLREAGAQMVKLEGGTWILETVQTLVTRGIPVCGHLGLTPQSVHQLGGYRVQGRSQNQAQTLLNEAQALQAAGAGLLILECVPHKLAQQITQALEIPVIGIGAGPDCDGQILVLYDILGLSEKSPRFAKNFMATNDSIAAALSAYVTAVKAVDFPSLEHSFS